MENHRIPFAYYNRDFSHGSDTLAGLKVGAEYVTPEEYDSYMDNNIYCPSCMVPLLRVPEDYDVTTSNMTAHFRHKRGFSQIPCDLRTDTPKGKKYEGEESIRQAIEDGELAIISGWAKNPPEIREAGPDREFERGQIFDEEGEEVGIPRGRHDGETFKVPSIISSVYSLCRNFPENLARYYYFPNSQSPVLLQDALVAAIKATTENIDAPYLYYGVVRNVIALRYRNIIKIDNEEFGRINLFTHKEHDEKRNISKSVIGRTLLFHGHIEIVGGQPRIMIEEWGQYALLPSPYERILEELRR